VGNLTSSSEKVAAFVPMSSGSTKQPMTTDKVTFKMPIVETVNVSSKQPTAFVPNMPQESQTITKVSD
jgi:hypothetical protein